MGSLFATQQEKRQNASYSQATIRTVLGNEQVVYLNANGGISCNIAPAR